MAQIEIGTSQNVGIRYEAANLLERIVATIIDATIMFGILVGAYLTVLALMTSDTSDALGDMIGWVFLAIAIPDALYPFLCETFWNGQSVGKRIMRIRVMRVDGTQPRVVDYFLRWLIGLAEIPVASGAIAAVAIIASKSNQRLGDMAAGTTVVRLPRSTTLSASFLEVDEQQRAVMFPQVRSLSDRDIAVIRDVLTTATSKAVTPQAATELVWKTKEKIESMLDVKAEMRPEEFLLQVIDDYHRTFADGR